MHTPSLKIEEEIKFSKVITAKKMLGKVSKVNN
jgi:hypothetical protein